MIVNLVPSSIENLNYINSIGPFSITYIQTGPPYSLKDNLLKCPLCNCNIFSALIYQARYLNYQYELKCYCCLYTCLLGDLSNHKLDFNSVACITV